MAAAIDSSVWDSVNGQSHAIEQLRLASINPVHAFLLIGPDGCGKEDAARILASVIIDGGSHPAARDNREDSRVSHPDVHEIVREGASILREQAEEVVRLASTTPVEGTRKVIIMHEVDLMGDAQIVRLLKTVEEPPQGVYFILLAEHLTERLVTFNSRTLTVNFGPLSDESIVRTLESEGIERELAVIVAKLAQGSLTRARLLASDPQLVQRHEFFANIPRRIDGTGATVIAMVDQILGMLDDAVEPLARRHEQEIADLETTHATMGIKRGGRKALDDRHKREIRRHRTDELRSGLLTIAGVYRDELTLNRHIHRPEAYVAAIDRIHRAMSALGLNVNESILLRDLVWSLPSPSADAALQFVLSEANK